MWAQRIVAFLITAIFMLNSNMYTEFFYQAGFQRYRSN